MRKDLDEAKCERLSFSVFGFVVMCVYVRYNDDDDDDDDYCEDNEYDDM